MLYLFIILGSIPAAAYIVTSIEARRMERAHVAALDAIQHEGAKEFKRMFDTWATATASKAA